LAGNETSGEQALPEGWAWARLGAVTQRIEKVNPRDDPDAKFIYLDISSIDNSINRVTEPKVYRGADAPSRARQLVCADDVLLSTVRTYLKNTALVPEQYDGQIASTGFSILRGQGALGRYLFYFALTDNFVAALSELQRGVSYPAVRDGDVRNQWIPLAPLPEQRRIVAEIETQFTRLEAGVAALKRAQANLRRYKASLLKAACEGRLVPTEAELARAEGRDYEPAEVLLARILVERRAKWEKEQWAKKVEKAKKKAAQARRKAVGLPARIKDLSDEEWQDLPPEAYSRYLPKNEKWKEKYKEPAPPDTSGLPELPEGWVWTTIGACMEVVRGASPRPKGDPRYFGGDIPWIRISDVTQEMGRFISQTKETVTDAGAKKSRFLNAGTLILSNSGTVCVPKILAVDGCIHDGFVAFLGLTGRINILFLYHYFENIRPQIAQEHRQGMTQVNLNTAIVRGIVLALPPSAEQNRIVAEVDRRLSVVQEIEKQVEAALRRAERLRQAILKHAFEGKLVPQDPNDEPASVLLERIQATRAAQEPPTRKPSEPHQARLPGV